MPGHDWAKDSVYFLDIKTLEKSFLRKSPTKEAIEAICNDPWIKETTPSRLSRGRPVYVINGLIVAKGVRVRESKYLMAEVLGDPPYTADQSFDAVLAYSLLEFKSRLGAGDKPTVRAYDGGKAAIL
ncbi:hypothetical protein BDP55DRAFT_744932 [Colletotrichum godetiae]|uniref:Uncharacterized protein n=1 Tax=Colletotrichum godetiae TaxID=1209918 RepID=A0AAJ0ESN3_9PEZI|nr:uncharacterized protein BDP55DRAFT_744932 [Colletotrichum godetiae]KAK1675261.1 hypothetical protein BDP55DRAFT_744932 [Colletotrichum godetiae]